MGTSSWEGRRGTLRPLGSLTLSWPATSLHREQAPELTRPCLHLTNTPRSQSTTASLPTAAQLVRVDAWSPLAHRTVTRLHEHSGERLISSGGIADFTDEDFWRWLKVEQAEIMKSHP